MSASIRPRWTAFVCSLANYLDAAALLTWSTVLVIYQGTKGFTPSDLAIGNGALTAAVTVGAVVGGRLGDRFGRRPVFIATMALILGGTLGMMIAGNLPSMVVATAVAGLGIGADLPVAASTIAESSATGRTRGSRLGLTWIFWLVGSIIPGLIATAVGNLGNLGATILLAHIAVVAIFTLVARVTIPESAIWRAARHQPTQQAERAAPRRASIADLLRKPYRAPFLALVLFYGLGGVALATAHYTVFMLVNYGGASVSSASLAGLFAIPTGLLGGILFMRAAGGTRRFLYFRVALIAYVALSLVPVVFGFSYLSYTTMAVLSGIPSSFAGDALSKVWAQRSFPTLIRNTAQGALFGVNRLVVTGAVLVMPMLIAVDVRLVFVAIAAATAIGGAAAWSVFRTRDKHDEIAIEQREFESDAAGARDSWAAAVGEVPS